MTGLPESGQLQHATVSPLIPRVVVDHHVHESAPKTERSRRRLALDPLTLQALPPMTPRRCAQAEAAEQQLAERQAGEQS